MIEWWSSLDAMGKVLWGITIAASLVFIIQSILTFIGADTGDMDADASLPDGTDGDAQIGTGQGLLTFRNFVNFFLGFGWSAVLLRPGIASVPLLMFISIVVGVALVFLVMMIFRWLSSMQQTGNIDVFKVASGCEGKVYLSIPAARAGEGKVQISINNAVREYAAVTDGPALPTGAAIRVVEAVSSDTLLVEAQESIII